MDSPCRDLPTHKLIRLGVISIYFLAVILIVACAQRIPGERVAGNGRIQGTIVGPDGKPVSGAYVTVKRADGAMAVTVFTDTSGQFEIPSFSGEYSLIGGGPGYAFKTIGSGKPDLKAPLRIVLEPSSDLRPYMSSADWLSARLPNDEQTREFLLTCGHCHEVGDATNQYGRERSKEDWEHIMKYMRTGPGGGAGSLSGYAVQPTFDIPKAAEWLIKHDYGPGAKTPNFQVPPPIEGESARTIFTEWFVPDKEAYIHDMEITPDGETAYAPDYYRDNLWVLKVSSNQWKKIPLPVSTHPAGMHSLTFDSEGNVWITVQLLNKIAKFSPSNEKFVFYDVPTPESMPHTPVFDSKGNLWFTEDGTNKVAMLDPKTGKFKEYTLPLTGELAPEWVLAYGIDIDSQDRVWYTKIYENTFGVIDPRSGEITQFKMADYAKEKYTAPRRLRVGPDDTVWIPEYTTSRISRFDPKTKMMKRYPLPIPNSCPYAFYVDKQRNVVWAGGNMSNSLFRFDPKTERFDTFYLPRGRISHTRWITQDRSGIIWTSYANDPAHDPAVVRLQLSSKFAGR